MDTKLKSAIKGVAVIVVALGVSMVAFYKVRDRLSHKDTLEEASNADPNSVGVGIAAEFEGVYAPVSSVSAGENRFSLFAIIKRDVGYGAVAKVTVAGSPDLVEMLCSEAKANPNEFFIRCSDPKVGEVTVDATPDKSKSPSSPDFSLDAKVFWRRGTDVVLAMNSKFSKINPNAASGEVTAPETQSPPTQAVVPPTQVVTPVPQPLEPSASVEPDPAKK